MIRFILFVFSMAMNLLSNDMFNNNINVSTKEEEIVYIETTTEKPTTEEQTTEESTVVTKPTTEVEVTTEKKQPEKTEEQTTSKPKEEEGKSKKLDFNCILQLPELPTGCEITSLTMVLNHLGIKADKLDLADNWLSKGEVGKVHPNEHFLGNPRDNKSFGCYAPVIINCANTYLQAMGRTDLSVYNLTGSTLEDLFIEIDNGNPIIIWATVDMKNPKYTRTWNINGKDFTWKSPEHCLVLTGYDTTNNKVYVADPLKGNVSYDLDTFKDRYIKLYSQAVVIK